MWTSRKELADLTHDVANLESRMRMVEEDSKTTKAIRQSRADRREFWTVKMLPSISASIVAILGLNAVFHWF